MLNGTTGENLSSITLTICCPRFKSSTPSTSFFISGLELMVPSPPSRSIPIAKFLIFLPIGPLDTEKAIDAAVVVPNSVIIAPFVAPKSKPLMSANG